MLRNYSLEGTVDLVLHVCMLPITASAKNDCREQQETTAACPTN